MHASATATTNGRTIIPVTDDDGDDDGDDHHHHPSFCCHLGSVARWCIRPSATRLVVWKVLIFIVMTFLFFCPIRCNNSLGFFVFVFLAASFETPEEQHLVVPRHTFERERKRRRSSFYNKRTIKRQRGEDKIKMASTSPAQLAAQMLGSLARVGAFVGVGATAVASALYDGTREIAYNSFFIII